VTRQEQAARTRESILDAAAEVFDAHGYQGAGLALILEQAGVTRGALYFHFASKEDLARELIQDQYDSLARHRDDGAEGLQALINLTFGFARDLVDEVRVRAGVRLVVEQISFAAVVPDAYQAWIELAKRLLVDAKRRGELARGVSAEDAARFIVGAFTGIQLASEVLTARQDIEERVADLWHFVLPALASSPQSMKYRPRRRAARAGSST
jgi:AcrR family transcriptional regulator